MTSGLMRSGGANYMPNGAECPTPRAPMYLSPPMSAKLSRTRFRRENRLDKNPPGLRRLDARGLPALLRCFGGLDAARRPRRSRRADCCGHAIGRGGSEFLGRTGRHRRSAAPGGRAGAEREPQNWFTGGRDQGGTYYSPLASITAANVGKLGFAWSYDLGAPQRGQESTPTVVDGVMYTSGTWGYVYALDAVTGKELWRYDPKVAPFAGRQPCCDLVNRGVAVWK